MRELHVKTSDCSYRELVRIAARAGFVIKEGGKHCKIETQAGQFVATIPRHSRLKRETARGIVEAMNRHEAKIDYS